MPQHLQNVNKFYSDLLYLKACVLGIFIVQEFHRLQDENIQLKTICEDQEQALEELGSKLSEYVGYLKNVSKKHDYTS